MRELEMDLFISCIYFYIKRHTLHSLWYKPSHRTCDFYPDCADASDEWSCGACDFESHHICGWEQKKDDDFDWTRHTGSTPSGSTGGVSHAADSIMFSSTFQ